MMENTAASSAALAEELRNVVRQAEDLMRAVGDDSGEVMGALRERVRGALEGAKSRLSDLEGRAKRATQQASEATDTYVRENPWTSVGVAAGIGLVLGMLLSRRSDG